MIKKMAIGICISIITLNMNGLNVPTKRHKLANKTHMYAVYKKPTSYLKTLKVRLKVRRWNNVYPCKWEAKEIWSSNPHVRQNRP